MSLTEPSTVVIPAPADMTDWESVREFQRRCDRSLARSCRRLVLDLTGVTGSDSKLVACLVVAIRQARRAAVAVEIKPSRSVRRWVRHCRCRDLLPLE